MADIVRLKQEGKWSTGTCATLLRAEMICSMSRKGNCWDNAVTESLFSMLKRELIYPNGIFTSREEARNRIFRYIETWYKGPENIIYAKLFAIYKCYRYI
jgi:hypothetical protein